MSVDAITITGTGLSAEISPLGAELVALRDASGHDLLWNGDPAFWAGRAPILFPIIGTLNGGIYRLAGKTYQLPRHGFARRRAFTLVVAEPDRATFRLDADAETRAVYPFDFRLDMSFAVEGSRIDIAAHLVNTGEGPLPASFGFHPAFRWPLPYGAPRGDYRLAFDTVETGKLRLLNADGLLDPTPLESPIKGRTLVLGDDLFTKDALIFTELTSRALTYGAKDGRQLKIAFPDTPHLGIWSKPGAPFVCIEPWQGHADPAGFAGDIWDRPGMVRVEAGESRAFRLSVELADA